MKSVSIEKGDPGTQRVVVVSDGSAEIDKAAAIESLGSKASRYVVNTWTKEGGDEG